MNTMNTKQVMLKIRHAMSLLAAKYPTSLQVKNWPENDRLVYEYLFDLVSELYQASKEL